MISHINFTSKKAEVTFKSAKLAQKSFIIDGVQINGCRLSVKNTCPESSLSNYKK